MEQTYNLHAAGSDYEVTTFTLTFQPSLEGKQQMHCGRIPIINDMVGNEPNEEFLVTFSTIEFGTVLVACIIIIDDDGKHYMEVEVKVAVYNLSLIHI